MMALVLAAAVGQAYARPATYADSPAAFLALLNAERARYGRAPLVWDQSLAAFAASNTAVHAPHSRPWDAGQCWSPLRSYTGAYWQWRRSPAHWTILINARRSVGVAVCSTGMTCNTR